MNTRPNLLKPVGPTSLASEPDFTLGGLLLRPSLREIRCGDRYETLEPRVMQVLVVLAHANGTVVSRDELIQQCWGGRTVGDDAINRSIAKVRQLAEFGGSKAFEIETIARVGYRLIRQTGNAIPISAESVAAAPALTASPTEATEPVQKKRPIVWIALGVTAAIAVAAAAIVGFYVFAPRPPGSAPPRAVPAATDTLRVAIIPFDVVGIATDATHAFADTLLDKVVEALSANQVETVTRADSRALRGGKAVAALASLRVGLTLEGSVQNDGKTITVRLHLDDVRQHETLWSKEFEGPADSPEPLQTQVALHATDVTRWAVSPRLKAIRFDPSLVSAYLEGEDENKNGGGGRSLAIARDLVSRAPRFAAAHTLLASTVGQENGLELITPEARAESSRQAKIAIALDGGDGQAYALLSANLPVLSFKEREELLIKGLSVDPWSASANWNYTVQILASTGRNEDAIAQARSAWQLVPFTEWVAWALPLRADPERIESG